MTTATKSRQIEALEREEAELLAEIRAANADALAAETERGYQRHADRATRLEALCLRVSARLKAARQAVA